MAWVASPARAAAERAGRARLGDQPALPEVIETTSRVLAFAPFDGPAADLAAEIARWPGASQIVEGTRRELLASIEGELNVARALARMEGEDGRRAIKRRDLDRWLDARVTIETVVGPSFGGVHPGWFRTQGGRVVCLRCDRGRSHGWRAIDLAGLSLESFVANDAPDVALAYVWAREHARSCDPRIAEALRALITAPREPERVRVWIEGPPFVDPRLWNAPGEEVTASRARWLLSNLDGLAAFGGHLRVRTEPAIRAGRAAPQREDRSARRRRLFSRWDEGIRADDEGLVGATPEALALRIAQGARGVVVDGTCGVGALAIAYAREPGVTRVIAIDRDRTRLAMARHNAAIYGVEAKVEFVCADVVERTGTVRADLLVLDPPWGGRDYDRERVALEDLGLDVAAVLERFQGPVVLKLPRSFDPATLPAGRWRIEPLVDDRGILKMLIARRER